MKTAAKVVVRATISTDPWRKYGIFLVLTILAAILADSFFKAPLFLSIDVFFSCIIAILVLLGREDIPPSGCLPYQNPLE